MHGLTSASNTQASNSLFIVSHNVAVQPESGFCGKKKRRGKNQEGKKEIKLWVGSDFGPKSKIAHCYHPPPSIFDSADIEYPNSEKQGYKVVKS